MYAGVATSCKIGPRETREPGYLRNALSEPGNIPGTKPTDVFMDIYSLGAERSEMRMIYLVYMTNQHINARSVV